MSTPAFEKIISGYSEDIQELARAARTRIYDILPRVVEIVWEQQGIAGYGTGPKKMSEHYHWLKAATKHVTLGFNNGSDMPDPAGLLEGSGKSFRHVKLKSFIDLDNQALEDLMRYATTHKVPPPG